MSTKFAVIETGGKQYKVAQGDVVSIEKLDTEIGKKVEFDSVLLIHEDGQSSIGQPTIENASVVGTCINEEKDDKVIVFKFKHKTGYKKKQGHRQKYTTIKIESINVGKKSDKTDKTDTIPASESTASATAKKESKKEQK